MKKKKLKVFTLEFVSCPLAARGATARRTHVALVQMPNGLNCGKCGLNPKQRRRFSMFLAVLCLIK